MPKKKDSFLSGKYSSVPALAQKIYQLNNSKKAYLYQNPKVKNDLGYRLFNKFYGNTSSHFFRKRKIFLIFYISTGIQPFTFLWIKIKIPTVAEIFGFYRNNFLFGSVFYKICRKNFSIEICCLPHDDFLRQKLRFCS